MMTTSVSAAVAGVIIAIIGISLAFFVQSYLEKREILNLSDGWANVFRLIVTAALLALVVGIIWAIRQVL